MSNFIKLSLAVPNDVEFVNLDCIMGIADCGNGKCAKLFMNNGSTYETRCTYSEFLQILNLSASES